MASFRASDTPITMSTFLFCPYFLPSPKNDKGLTPYAYRMDKKNVPSC